MSTLTANSASTITQCDAGEFGTWSTRPATRPRRRAGRRGPRVAGWHPAAPGQRPVQPAAPLASSSAVMIAPRRQPAPVATASRDEHAPPQLGDLALAIIMVGFLLAILVGATVAVAQYIALAG